MSFRGENPKIEGLEITKSSSGADVASSTKNTSNTSSSSATSTISTGGASAADPTQVFTVTGEQSYTLGIDNSDSDKFKLSKDSSLSNVNGDVMVVDSSGNTTFNKPVTAEVRSTLHNTSLNYNVLDNDGYSTITVTAASDKVVTLPTAADNSGRVITVKKIDSGSGSVSLDGEGSETVDGVTGNTQALLSQNDHVTVQSNGTAWYVIARSVKNRYFHNYLTANVTTNTTMSDLTFSGLVTGRTYKVHLQANIVSIAGDTVAAQINHNSTVIAETKSKSPDGSNAMNSTTSADAVFVAAASTVTFVSSSINAGSSVNGNSTYNLTWARLEELNDQGT